MKLRLTWAFFAATVPFTYSTSLTISFPPQSRGSSPNALPPSTHATLTSGISSQAPLRAVLTRRSTMIFSEIERPGSYLLDIHTRDTVFAPYRVDVESDGRITGIWETFRGSPWEDRGGLVAGNNGEKDALIEPKVLGRRNFYEERPGFSPLGLLKSPMILLALVALAAMVGMPYLMENMDPEMRAEFEEQQKNSPLAGMTRTMQGQGGGAQNFDLAGWLAGSNPQQGGGASTTSGSDTRDGGARRRA